MSLSQLEPMMTAAAALLAGLSAAILLWFLVVKPKLDTPTKLALLFGFGVFPIGVAGTTNIAGFKYTTERQFCGGCHVMLPYTNDSSDPLSTTLAARHARNETFGPNNCYECHREYGAFSTLLTKWGGMLHVYEYYTEYHAYSIDKALTMIELYKPFLNASCMRCHSTETPMFSDLPDHSGQLARLRDGEVSCVSGGCHGPVHPFSKAGHRDGQTAALPLPSGSHP